jgi:hypothetical protein
MEHTPSIYNRGGWMGPTVIPVVRRKITPPASNCSPISLSVLCRFTDGDGLSYNREEY